MWLCVFVRVVVSVRVHFLLWFFRVYFFVLLRVAVRRRRVWLAVLLRHRAPSINNNVNLCFAAGFVHSAFTFAHESLMGRTNTALRSEIPAGALVSFLHKGLQFLQIETHLDEVRRC